MTEHAFIVVVVAVAFTVQLVGLFMLGRMVRESQRLTRAVAGLVDQSSLTSTR